jgi:RNA polymerase sigma-70 factor (ECF subfamily)
MRPATAAATSPWFLASDRDELDLLDRAKAGDPDVWRTWYDQAYPFLFRYALSRLGRREEAEDIASQVFLEAFKSIHRYQPQEKPILAWLYGICRNLTANRARKHARELRANGRLWTVAPGDESDALLVESVDLKRALAELTQDQREILTLRFRMGLPTREVAGLVGKSEAAVYSLQVRAIASLRRRLAA